ncbi:MAG: histone family protein [Candidatus Woesearchaeota archaeon]
MPQQRKTQTIPKAPVARILMNAGAKRVSAEASEAFADILHENALKIGEKAAMIAKHSGRKTVHEGDVKLAARR